MKYMWHITSQNQAKLLNQPHLRSFSVLRCKIKGGDEPRTLGLYYLEEELEIEGEEGHCWGFSLETQEEA